MCWLGLFANLWSYSWKFNAMKRMREAASSEQYLLPRTNKVSQEAAEVRIRSITRWSTMVTTNFFHVSPRTSQAGLASAVMSMSKNVWSEHLTLFYCCCCAVITQSYSTARYQVWETGQAIERENKVGEIANQLKINSWELLAFIALFPFPPPVSPRLTPPGQNIFSISDTRTLHNWLVNSVFVRIVGRHNSNTD